MHKSEFDVTRMELGGAIATLYRLHERLLAAEPVEPPVLSDEHRGLGYRVEPIRGTHDGYGNEYVRVTLNGVAVLDAAARVSMGDRDIVRGFIAGHAKATAEWLVITS